MIAKLGVLALLSLTACPSTEPDDLRTDLMSATIEAMADGSGSTTVGASLFRGPPSDLIFIDLIGDDRLIVHHEGQAKDMIATGRIPGFWYTATVDGEGAELELELRRGGETGARISLVTLPAPFTLGTVPSSVSRGADFGVNWTGSSPDPMRWSASGTCIEAASGTIAGDPGSVTMPAGTFRKAPGATTPDSCQVRVTVTRERGGEVDPVLGHGGTATGVQARTVTFTSTP